MSPIFLANESSYAIMKWVIIMNGTHQALLEKGSKVFHGEYCLYHCGCNTAFNCGVVRCVWVSLPEWDMQLAEVRVVFTDGEECIWKTEHIDGYTSQFGCSVSADGKYVFAQTWERGLFCLDARTGEMVWRTKSKRGITHIFVNKDTVLCHQHGHSLQLLDIPTGELIREKKPATAWGFTALDHQHIICQVTARRWEVIDTRTLETVDTFSHPYFTGGHIDYCVNEIELTQKGTIKVCGFKNVWDTSVKPAKMLPNLEFEHYVEMGTSKTLS